MSFQPGDQVRHRGTGLEALFVPRIAGVVGTVFEVRPRYKRDGYTAQVDFGGSIVPLDCEDLEAYGPDSPICVHPARKAMEELTRGMVEIAREYEDEIRRKS